MQKLLLFLLCALVLEAMGVVFLSKGLKELGDPVALTTGEIGRMILRGVSNGHVLLGVAMETAFFVMLMVLLKKHDVSLIWPLTSFRFKRMSSITKNAVSSAVPRSIQGLATPRPMSRPISTAV